MAIAFDSVVSIRNHPAKNRGVTRRHINAVIVINHLGSANKVVA
jgi:hypothetical protein